MWLGRRKESYQRLSSPAPVQRTMHVLGSHLPAMGTSLPSETSGRRKFKSNKILERDEGETLPVVPQSVLDKNIMELKAGPGRAGRLAMVWKPVLSKSGKNNCIPRGMRKRPLTYR